MVTALIYLFIDDWDIEPLLKQQLCVTQPSKQWIRNLIRHLFIDTSPKPCLQGFITKFFFGLSANIYTTTDTTVTLRRTKGKKASKQDTDAVQSLCTSQ